MALTMSIHNFQSMKSRIDNADTLEALHAYEKSLDRLWNVGAFTVAEFKRLDSLIIDKQIKIEE